MYNNAMTITEIKKIGKTNRYKIFVDEEFYAVLLDEDIIKNNLKIGLEVNEKTLKEICFHGQKRVALDQAMKLLGTYSKTKKELRLYLKNKGYTSEVQDFVCERLEEYKCLNDETYADIYIKANSSKKGKRLIAYELKQKGICQHIISERLENVEDCAKMIAVKYMRGKILDEKNKQKLYRYLSSKGFDYESIFDAMNEIFMEEDF